MLNKIAESIYNSYLAEFRRGSAASDRRLTRLRRIRRQLLKMGDPEIIVKLDDFAFKTPFSSNIILFHFEYPFYDSTLPRLARAVAKAGGKLVMVDVGANVGACTYLVSRETPGQFFCVEANPRFKASLQHNLAQIPNARARFAALTDENRQTSVRHNYIDGNSNIEAAPAGGETLEFVKLDDALAAERDFPPVNLLKIDTEGFELKILRGATGLLAASRPPLFFEFFPDFIRREGGEPDALFELLRQHGYDYFIFYDGGGWLLASVNGAAQFDQLQALRRYCELRKSFFDVVAFHAADAGLRRDFEASEIALFEHSLRPAKK